MEKKSFESKERSLSILINTAEFDNEAKSIKLINPTFENINRNSKKK